MFVVYALLVYLLNIVGAIFTSQYVLHSPVWL